MKKFNPFKIFLCSIKTKVAIKFPKKNSLFCYQNWLGAERLSLRDIVFGIL